MALYANDLCKATLVERCTCMNILTHTHTLIKAYVITLRHAPEYIHILRIMIQSNSTIYN